MGPLSYLHNDLPKISGVWILPYCIGDREVTENAEWDTLQFVKVGGPMERLTKMYNTSPESWATWLLPQAENPHLRVFWAKRRQNHTFFGLRTSSLTPGP